MSGQLNERLLSQVESSRDNTRIVAIGEPSHWHLYSRVAGSKAEISSAQFAEASNRLDEILAAEIVMSTVVFGGNDCVDLAMLLNENSYQGRYAIIVDNVPNPRMLLAELHACSPGLAIEIVHP